MTASDYREQALNFKSTPCPHGFFRANECAACLASWASRIAEEERRAGVESAIELLIGCWDDGEQGPPRSEIENYSEIRLLRSLARRARGGGGEGR